MDESSRRRVVGNAIGRIGVGDKSAGIALSAIEASGVVTHTTICLRPSRGLRMNLRVRRVTGASESAMVAVLRDFGDQDREVCWWLDFALKRSVFCWTPNCAWVGLKKIRFRGRLKWVRSPNPTFGAGTLRHQNLEVGPLAHHQLNCGAPICQDL